MTKARVVFILIDVPIKPCIFHGNGNGRRAMLVGNRCKLESAGCIAVAVSNVWIRDQVRVVATGRDENGLGFSGSGADAREVNRLLGGILGDREVVDGIESGHVVDRGDGHVESACHSCVVVGFVEVSIRSRIFHGDGDGSCAM